MSGKARQKLKAGQKYLVAVADFDKVVCAGSLRIRFVQTLDEDLAGVAADVGDAHRGQDGPVTTVVNSVRQRNDEHPLKRRTQFSQWVRNNLKYILQEMLL